MLCQTPFCGGHALVACKIFTARLSASPICRIKSAPSFGVVALLQRLKHPRRGDGIGRRSGLKHRRRKVWGFKSPPRHQMQTHTYRPNQMTTKLCLDDFDYDLPPELIAQMPLAVRTASRLLHLCGGEIADRQFKDLPSLLYPNDLLVVNDTRVLHARLFGQKSSGGQVEVLVERVLACGDEVLAQVRASKPPRTGSTIRLEGAFEVAVMGREGEFYRLKFPADALALAERHGRLPLPPYIERGAADTDESRYQTVYASEKGSVAAPTAGLHFDDALLAQLSSQGVQRASVTLHVGAGTFQPVRVQNLNEHQMHSERYFVPAATIKAIAETRANGGRVVAVGTTSLRALESAYAGVNSPVGAGNTPSSGETKLFITPGFQFQVVDALITNFHLPKSTLLMLVSAFSGVNEIRAAYAHAITCSYRFFSYGDAMFLERNSS